MDRSDLHDPWLVAAWPGMGAVALGAATYLLEQLEPITIADLTSTGYFEITQVGVGSGLIRPANQPQSTLYAWQNPDVEGRDLLLFIGEAQPATRGLAFCHDLLDVARDWGVRRAFTFAAMATPSHPQAKARVCAVGSRPDVLAELQGHGIEVLGEGEISGLNGILLAAAMESGMEAACLLGEFPYFASGIRNPKASAAVLRAFCDLAGVTLDFTALDAEAAQVEASLTQLLERLQRAGQAPPTLGVEAEEEPPFPGEAEEMDEEGSAPRPPALAPADEIRLEHLFDEARRDRTQALKLKAELDRLGVFKQYEDRFLDLFKRGE